MKGYVAKFAPLALLFLAPLAHAQQAPAGASAQPCLSRSQITAATTPATMMAALPRCVQENRMEDAVDMFNIAGIFAYFDRQRVVDETAHGAYEAMKMQAVIAMGDELTKRFEASMKYQSAPERMPAYIAQMCTFSKRVGPPTYKPTYMLAHGMSAFIDRPGGLVPGFDPAQGWQTTLTKYLKCPA